MHQMLQNFHSKIRKRESLSHCEATVKCIVRCLCVNYSYKFMGGVYFKNNGERTEWYGSCLGKIICNSPWQTIIQFLLWFHLSLWWGNKSLQLSCNGSLMVWAAAPRVKGRGFGTGLASLFFGNYREESCTHLHSNLLMRVKLPIRSGPAWKLQPNPSIVREGLCPAVVGGSRHRKDNLYEWSILIKHLTSVWR